MGQDSMFNTVLSQSLMGKFKNVPPFRNAIIELSLDNPWEFFDQCSIQITHREPKPKMCVIFDVCMVFDPESHGHILYIGYHALYSLLKGLEGDSHHVFVRVELGYVIHP